MRKRNKHNLSNYKLGTCFPGELIPVGWLDISPGDSIQQKTSALIRFAPMVAPLMHRVQARIHTFFVPYRLLWDDWEDFITGNVTPPPTFPTIQLYQDTATPECDRLYNYLGCPKVLTGATEPTVVSAMPARAYNCIFNYWIRDQDLVTELDVKAATVSDFAVRRIAWQKDRYSAARPWPQKGPEITLPLGTSAPIIDNPDLAGVAAAQWITDGLGNNVSAMSIDGAATDALRGTAATAGTAARISALASSSPDTNMWVADLSEAASATVNAIRRAMALQRLGERYAQFGSRYSELLLSMGVKSDDARLQNPEHIGTTMLQLNFSEVLGTDSTNLGEMGGHGITAKGGRPFRKFFQEHGIVMSLMSIRPQAVYSTALPRKFFHGIQDGKHDFYTPELERIGQQAIYQKEIYPGTTDDGEVWGWNDQYDEFKHEPSQVCGEFEVGSSLDMWTWARGFAAPPALNATFVTCTPEPRIFADEVAESIYYGVNHNIVAYKLLTKNPIGRIM